MDYYNEIKNYQILTKEEERQLFINFKNGDLKKN